MLAFNNFTPYLIEYILKIDFCLKLNLYPLVFLGLGRCSEGKCLDINLSNIDAF